VILSASLDTSFWNIAGQLGIVPYLFDYFDVYYCNAVEREIVTIDPDETPLVYPQAMLFQVLKEDGRLHRRDPEKPLSLFGRGEAHAIALASEQSWVLLINDGRPLAFARNLSIRCVSVPSFCTLLYSQGKITYTAAQGYLQRLTLTTSMWLLEEAERFVENIAIERGDLR
jgi:hypothetical protein